MDTQERNYLIYAAIGLGVLVFAVMALKGNSSNAGTVNAPSSAELNYAKGMYEDANNYSLARGQQALSALAAYNNSQTQLELGLANISANYKLGAIQANDARDIANTQANTQVQVAQLEAQTAATVANYEAQTSKYIAGQQSAASQAQSHAQQQSSIWGDITSFVTSALSFFKPATNNPGTAQATQVSYSPEVGPAQLPPGLAFG